ncbi:hypothetical protein EJB05_27657, partial [Eragrostis curvula]
MEAKKPYVIAIVIQMIYAGLLVVSKAAFNHGMNTFFTSATVASAAYNGVPVATFCIALLFRKEVVKPRSPYGIAKLTGVAFCLAGVFVIAFYTGPALSPVNHHHAFAIHAAHGMDQRDIPHGPCRIGIVPVDRHTVHEVTCIHVHTQAGLLEEYPNKMLVTLSHIVGGLLLVGGLYSVLWGKNKEKKVALCNEAGRTEDEQNHIHAEEGKGDMEAAVEEELSKCSKGS